MGFSVLYRTGWKRNWTYLFCSLHRVWDAAASLSAITAVAACRHDSARCTRGRIFFPSRWLLPSTFRVLFCGATKSTSGLSRFRRLECSELKLEEPGTKIPTSLPPVPTKCGLQRGMPVGWPAMAWWHVIEAPVQRRQDRDPTRNFKPASSHPLLHLVLPCLGLLSSRFGSASDGFS